jgi:monooxygenase
MIVLLLGPMTPAEPTPSRPIETHEHLDILVVGAGLSGIDAGYRLQTGDPALRYAIFEARDATGGTWDLFRYPGIRSDSDMATLGFPFRPWREGKAIADGPDILRYLRETAQAHGIDARIRLRHRVVAADWSSAEARWTVRYEADGVARRMTCGFLFLCSGYYDYAQAHAPRWPGMDAFGGEIVHPQFWPETLDLAGKRVIVIGSGATAVTLVPALARTAAHVVMLQRSPSYIVSAPSRDRGAERLRRRLPPGLADIAIRWKNIALTSTLYALARRRPEKLKAMLATGQRRMLGPDFEMAGHFSPTYEPWDQRLCLVPDGDLFKTLRKGAAEIVTDRIARFTAAGLVLETGRELPADVIVTATGLKMQLMGGATLRVDGETVDPATRMLYRGAMLEGVPNFAFAVGYTNASWTLRCDITARFVSRLLAHMKQRRQASVRPVARPGTTSDAPMIDLTSGYVERAAGLLPRQGARAPWRVRQNYVLDLLAFRTGRMRDGVLRYERARKTA